MTHLPKSSLGWITALLLIAVTVNLSARSKKSKLRRGDDAPAFSLKGDDGKTYSLSDFSNQKVVLYFYPLDDSHYCTQQSCSLARGYAPYKENNIQLFGINHQSIESHAAFKKKHHLPFTLLSDPSSEVITAYGAYSPFFTKRITILIENGKIVKVLRKIDVTNHADQILKAFDIKL